MKPKLMVDRVQKDIFSNNENTHFAFMLKVPKSGFVPERNFGFLFSDSDIYSLSWEGNLDFKKIDFVLNESFLSRVAYSLKEIITDLEWVKNSTVTRSIDVISIDQGKRSHHKFDIFKTKQKKECEILLSQRRKVAFVRQDIIIHSDRNNFHYAITAVNKNCSGYNNTFPEVGILFPIEHSFNLLDFKWLMNLHKYKSAFDGNIDTGGSIAEISKCIKKLKTHTVKKEDTEIKENSLTKEPVQKFKKIIS